MSKFASIIILALAMVAYTQANPIAFPEEQESQAIITEDNEEIAALQETPYSVFSDFCLTSRDNVFNDIKKNTNELSSRIYAIFFNNVKEIGSEALGVSRMGAERMSAQLVDPDAPIAEPTNEAERIIAEGQQNIQKTQTQPKALIEAFKSTVKAVSETGLKMLAQRMESLKGLAEIGTVFSSMQNVCSTISRYESRNRELFQKSKLELVKSDPKLALVEMSQVPCATSRRVTRLESMCTFVVAAKNPLQKMAATFSRSQQ